MDPAQAVVDIYECDDSSAAFECMVEALAGEFSLQCALRVGASDHDVVDRWPAGAEVTDDLLDTAVHVLRPEIFPLGSQFPFDANTYPNAEMLLLPLRRYREDAATIVLIAEKGALGEDLESWERLADAFERFEQRLRRMTRSEQEIDELRQRAEESEALHTLGLAANRTLDTDEVLNLVARFTRTLLGAHYAVVHTGGQGERSMPASVGLRNGNDDEGSGNAGDGDDDYELARRIIDAEKPLTIGGPESDLDPVDFPFHERQGMRIGLGIPLSLFGNTFGALIVGYRRDYDLSARDSRLAMTLAGHAAVAISNARLHEQVERHSQDLSDAYEQLREATRAKEHFFNAVSHDLRTPVGAIKGYNELMLEGLAGELPEKAREYLDNSRRAAETLLTLVNDIMDFAKLEAGKLKLTIESASIEEIVEDALSTVRPQAEAANLDLGVELRNGLPELDTDPKRVRQILVNLLSNAVKFTESGRVDLTVEPVDDAEIVLRVADTGPGISPEDQRRIFEEFEQVEGSAGTGLGLPISKKLAQLLGGDLTVESEFGAGSTFTLRVPVRPPESVSVDDRPADGGALSLITPTAG